MNQMEIFKNPEFGSIRTFEQDGKVLFCGTDVAQLHSDTAKPRQAALAATPAVEREGP